MQAIRDGLLGFSASRSDVRDIVSHRTRRDMQVRFEVGQPKNRVGLVKVSKDNVGICSLQFLINFCQINLLYLSAQLTRWYALTGAMMVESGQLVAR